jgi:DNA-directed RNA polymerase omega subunit
MIPVQELTKHGDSVYAVVTAAAKRARVINDWRIQRARVLFEEPTGPKSTTQALQEISEGVVTIVDPRKKQ